MITPTIVLCLLICSYLGGRLIGGINTANFGGVLGIAFAFGFFGIGHFVETEAMIRMLPPFMPFATLLVLATGLLELAIAFGLLYAPTRYLSGLVAIAVLIGFFPANIYAALNHTGMGGHAWGPVYLLIRAPLQAFLIWWAWNFVLRPAGFKFPQLGF